MKPGNNLGCAGVALFAACVSYCLSNSCDPTGSAGRVLNDARNDIAHYRPVEPASTTTRTGINTTAAPLQPSRQS